MTPRINSVLLSLGLAALAAGCGHSSNINKESERGNANEKMESMLDSMRKLSSVKRAPSKGSPLRTDRDGKLVQVLK